MGENDEQIISKAQQIPIQPWNRDSTAKVTPQLQYALNRLNTDQIYFAPKPGETEEQYRQRYTTWAEDWNEQAQEDWLVANRNCKGTALTSNQRVAKQVGIPSYRTVEANKNLGNQQDYKIPDATGKKSQYQVNSWDWPSVAANAASDKVTVTSPGEGHDTDASLYPLGSLFSLYNTENGNHYIDSDYDTLYNTVDGKVVNTAKTPGHTTTTIGAIQGYPQQLPNGKRFEQSPYMAWSDYGYTGFDTEYTPDGQKITVSSDNKVSPLGQGSYQAQYVTWPKEARPLTIPNLQAYNAPDAHKYVQDSFFTFPEGNSDSGFNFDLSKMSPQERDEFKRRIHEVDKKYKIGYEESRDLMKLAYSIAGQESNFGNPGFPSNIQYNAPDALKTFIKEKSDEYYNEDPSKYDTKPLWKYEIEYAKKLEDQMNQGVLRDSRDNLTLNDRVQAAIRDEMEKRKQEGKPELGKVMPRRYNDVTNHSKTMFQIKDDPNLRQSFPEIWNENNTGPSGEIQRGYSKITQLYHDLKDKYRDLNHDELLRATAVGWNNATKVNDPEFINYFIRGKEPKLRSDDYLNKVNNQGKKLYGNNAPIKENVNIKEKNLVSDVGNYVKRKTGVDTSSVVDSVSSIPKDFNKAVDNVTSIISSGASSLKNFIRSLDERLYY